MFPDKYKLLEQTSWSDGRHTLLPIRYEDRLAIMQWRNEQLYHLRQQQPLTEADQERYFTQVVTQLFDQEHPGQLLFSYLEDGKLIGYGGLVHINWTDRHAEISFVLQTEFGENDFQFHWKTYLGLLEQIAFGELHFHKIFTYAYDIRPQLYPALEAAGFRKEATLSGHYLFEGDFIDVLIHSKHNDLRLRRAVSDDAKLLFDLANDPDVRRNSLNNAPIVWEGHLSWLKLKLDSAHSRIYILEKAGQPLGQIRIDPHLGSYEIDYAILPEYRGNGFGKTIVALLLKHYPGKQFRAIVKKENRTSMRVFERLGFTLQHENDELTTFVYDA